MQHPAESFDVAVIGAGAAGLMCASVAGRRGARVVLVDHATRLAEKIRILGGGRCNFTNVDAGQHERYLSENPRFARSALTRYTPSDFIALVRRHGIAFHEKHRGQLFCDDSAEQIIAMLKAECDAGGVQWRMPCAVHAVRAVVRGGRAYELDTDAGVLCAPRVVIATGGLSIPKIGASDFGYRIARQFGLRIVQTRPALVPLTFDAETWKPFAELAGVSIGVRVRCNDGVFEEDLLFTHRAPFSEPSHRAFRSTLPALSAPSARDGTRHPSTRAMIKEDPTSPCPTSWLPPRLPATGQVHSPPKQP